MWVDLTTLLKQEKITARRTDRITMPARQNPDHRRTGFQNESGNTRLRPSFGHSSDKRQEPISLARRQPIQAVK